MIKIITGSKGAGKSKVLIEEANEAVKKAKGYIVYVDTNNSRMFQIDYRIRFTNMKDYKIENAVGFYGFLSGIIASNYDVESIYVDGLLEITNDSLANLEEFFNKLGKLELKYNVSFYFTVPDEEQPLPAYLSKYKLQQIAVAKS